MAKATDLEDFRWHPSLSSSLSPIQQTWLRRATREILLRNHTAAHVIFRDALQDYPTNYVLGIEYGRLLFDQERYGDTSKFCKQLLATVQAIPHHVKLLLKFMCATAEMYCEGRTKETIKQLRSARTWLVSRRLEDHDDVMLHGDLLYVEVVKKMRDWSKSITEDDIDWLRESEVQEGSHGSISRLRERLLSLAKTKTVYLVHALELALTDLEGGKRAAMITHVENVISDCKDLPARQPIILTLALRLLGSLMMEDGRPGMVWTICKQLKELNKGYSSAVFENTVLDQTLLLRLNDHERSDPKKWEALADQARRFDDLSLVAKCLDIAANLAAERVKDGNADYESYCHVEKSLQSLYHDRMQNLPALLNDRTRYYSTGGTKDLFDQLEWFSEFNRAHPFFDLPGPSFKKLWTYRMVAQRCGDQETALRASEEALAIKNSLFGHSPLSDVPPQTNALFQSLIHSDSDLFYLEQLLNRLNSIADNGIPKYMLRGLFGDRVDASRGEGVKTFLKSLTAQSLLALLFQDAAGNRLLPGGWAPRLHCLKKILSHTGTFGESDEKILAYLQSLRILKYGSTVPWQLYAEIANYELLVQGFSDATQQALLSGEHITLHLRSTRALRRALVLAGKQRQQLNPIGTLIQCRDDFISIMELLETRINTNFLARQYAYKAWVSVQLWELTRHPPIEEIEGDLTSGDLQLEAYRFDMNALSPSKRLMRMSGFSDTQGANAYLHEAAITLFLACAEDPSLDRLTALQKLWNWVQRFKSRALTNIVGLTAVIPQSLRAAAQKNEECRHLLAQEAALRLELLTVAESSFKHRLKQEEIFRKMGQKIELRDIVALRKGSVLSYESISALFSELPPNVLYVEWFTNVVSATGTRELLMLTYRHGEEPAIHKIEKAPVTPNPGPWEPALWENILKDWTLTHVEQVQAGRAGPLNSHEAYPELQKLHWLVEPLQGIVQPSDTLLFCPTSHLQHIPIHALKLNESEDSILIRKNPVVYSQSLSLLRICRWTRGSTKGSPGQDLRSIFIRPELSHNPGRVQYPEFSTLRLDGQDATLTSVVEELTDVELVHFHGHTNAPDPDQPLESSLMLSRPSESTRSETRLAARTVIESVALAKGAHVSMIACYSGFTKQHTGDETIGLLPAFFLAGASSVLSTMWPIFSEDGHDFSQLFYKGFASAASHESRNLAERLQQAVVDTMFDEGYNLRPLKRWAGFRLHGDWLLWNRSLG